jgi:tetratricopeptide (TPR) repeat protein
MADTGWTKEEIYLLAERGYAFYLQGCYDEAAVIFEGVLAIEPRNAYCRTALSAVCLSMGDAQRAARELTALLEQNPADYDARARRCEAFCDLGRWNDARQDLAVLQRNGDRNHVPRLTWRLQAGGAMHTTERRQATS